MSLEYSYDDEPDDTELLGKEIRVIEEGFLIPLHTEDGVVGIVTVETAFEVELQEQNGKWSCDKKGGSRVWVGMGTTPDDAMADYLGRAATSYLECQQIVRDECFTREIRMEWNQIFSDIVWPDDIDEAVE